MLLRPVYELALFVALSDGGDPRTALKNVKDMVLEKLHAARPRKTSSSHRFALPKRTNSSRTPARSYRRTTGKRARFVVEGARLRSARQMKTRQILAQSGRTGAFVGTLEETGERVVAVGWGKCCWVVSSRFPHPLSVGPIDV